MIKRIAAAAAGIAAAVVFVAAPIVPSVTVREERSGRLAAVLPARIGETLRLSFVHSVNKGGVLEEFRIDPDGALVLFRSVHQSFGAGMSDGLDPGVTLRLTEDGVELTGLERRIGALNLGVGTVAGHRLAIGSRDLALASAVPPGSLVTIAFERVPPLAALLKRMGNERE